MTPTARKARLCTARTGLRRDLRTEDAQKMGSVRRFEGKKTWQGSSPTSEKLRDEQICVMQ